MAVECPTNFSLSLREEQARLNSLPAPPDERQTKVRRTSCHLERLKVVQQRLIVIRSWNLTVLVIS